MSDSKTQKKILIIDDDELFNATTAELLKIKGFRVCSALNAETGLEAFALEKPDALLLDVYLPDKNGFDVLKIIRNSNDFAEIPVIVITGDTAILVDKAFDAGADDCVFKPLDIDDIEKRILKLIK
ncbi:MAG: response regulator [Elusimicrobia bacterium]|nr:response regulator [Elusimicrobiota bacterium]